MFTHEEKAYLLQALAAYDAVRKENVKVHLDVLGDPSMLQADPLIRDHMQRYIDLNNHEIAWTQSIRQKVLALPWDRDSRVSK